MKKSLLLVLVCLTFVFSGCKKEEKDTFNLVGKRYVYSPLTVKDNGEYLYWVCYFINDREVEKQVRVGSTTGRLFSEIEKNTYVLNYPELTIIEANGAEFTYTFVTKTTFRSDFNSTEYNLEK